MAIINLDKLDDKKEPKDYVRLHRIDMNDSEKHVLAKGQVLKVEKFLHFEPTNMKLN